jgi:hypothetical protein
MALASAEVNSPVVAVAESFLGASAVSSLVQPKLITSIKSMHDNPNSFIVLPPPFW